MGNHFLLQGQGADSIPVGKGLLGTGCVPMLCQVGGGGAVEEGYRPTPAPGPGSGAARLGQTQVGGFGGRRTTEVIFAEGSYPLPAEALIPSLILKAEKVRASLLVQ